MKKLPLFIFTSLCCLSYFITAIFLLKADPVADPTNTHDIINNQEIIETLQKRLANATQKSDVADTTFFEEQIANYEELQQTQDTLNNIDPSTQPKFFNQLTLKERILFEEIYNLQIIQNSRKANQNSESKLAQRWNRFSNSINITLRQKSYDLLHQAKEDINQSLILTEKYPLDWYYSKQIPLKVKIQLLEAKFYINASAELFLAYHDLIMAIDYNKSIPALPLYSSASKAAKENSNNFQEWSCLREDSALLWQQAAQSIQSDSTLKEINEFRAQAIEKHHKANEKEGYIWKDDQIVIFYNPKSSDRNI